MPDDTPQPPKEPESEQPNELTPEPVAELTLDILPAEPVQVEPSLTTEPPPELPAEASAEAEENPPTQAPPIETIESERAQSENEPFSEVKTTPLQEQPSAVPVVEIPTESEPNPPPAPQPTPQAPVPPFANFTTRAREMLAKARAAIQERKRKKLDRILILLNEKKNIGNDDVEKLLHVSDATATRYLNQLEREGKIVQVGKTGQSVRYVRSS